jgi:hypothetical protein
MKDNGILLNCDEALQHIEMIPDPITKSLVNLAFVHLVKQVHLEKKIPLRNDLDMLFLVTSLKDFFAEHEVLARTLEGERVGAWFGDNTRVDHSTSAAEGPAVDHEMDRKLNLSLAELNLSVRTTKCLENAGITKVRELVVWSADELLGMINFGVTTLNDVRDTLHKLGLHLRGD